MNYQIRVVSCRPGHLEADLNQPASEGWALVSCWRETETVMAVFQRPVSPEVITQPVVAKKRPVPSAVETQSSAAPADAVKHLPDLDALVALCLAQPMATNKSTGAQFRRGLSLKTQAKALGITPEVLLAHIQSLGVKEATADGQQKDKWHADHYLKLAWDQKSATWYLNAQSAPAKKKA